MKKVYKHPHYRYPSLYDDIAMIELGRRIEYNFDKVDSNDQIDQKKINVNFDNHFTVWRHAHLH